MQHLQQDDTDVRETRRDTEARNDKSRDCTVSHVRVAIRNVTQHGLKEKGISESEQPPRHYGAPEVCLSIAREGEPEQRNGEAPDGDQRRQESGFGADNAAIANAVALEEVGLDGHEHEHYGDSDSKIEICEVSAQV